MFTGAFGLVLQMRRDSSSGLLAGRRPTAVFQGYGAGGGQKFRAELFDKTQCKPKNHREVVLII